MSFTFKDRQSAYPNRYKVTPESGSAYYATLERADEPTEVGTPLNAETFNAIMAEASGGTFPYQEGLGVEGCYGRSVGGETEWVNPPMENGVVYRLTERWQHNPVYTVRKAVSTTSGALANGLDIQHIVSIEAVRNSTGDGEYFPVPRMFVENGTVYYETLDVTYDGLVNISHNLPEEPSGQYMVTIKFTKA